ncbi:MAG: threonine--tRNA ligase [Bacillota bacterium]|nr:threonine--tRNA ligase [Bacillota bacterium]
MEESHARPDEKLTIQVKDLGSADVTSGTTVFEMLGKVSRRMQKEAVAARINDKIVDLNTPLQEEVTVEVLTFDDPEGAAVYRHTASHVMAQAVKELYGNVKLGIGPAISSGFYYDFDLDTTLSTEDLEKIEKQIQKIIKEDQPLERIEVSRDRAVEIFKEKGENYKIELISDLPEDVKITCYRQGEFLDLCSGPHLPSTGKLKSLKLLNLAGAYWRGSEKNPMLQRIYGTAFPKQKLLDEYLALLEEARKRDHRKLGKELDLFSFHEEGPGFPFYHPRGIVIRRELEKFWRDEHRRAGYLEIETPIILNRQLWEQSGHWDHYQENMYFTKIDDQDYAIKPMNCPGSMLIYKSGMHSYRDFPLRVAEMGLVHRHEKSGTLHGLMRVRSFTQDDAHIFMLPEQIEDEAARVIDLVDKFYQVFGFEYHVELSTKPEKSMGSDQIWERATTALQSVLDKKEITYKINEGDGAFYGPKIDFHLQDSLGRTWQCGTIQLDFQMPEKFDLNYIGADGQKHRPAMIHRVVYGAMERFFALLIEHYGGAFPLWLAPVQAVVIPITERQHDYAFEVKNFLWNEDIRVEIDDRSEKVGYKIREAQVQKIPYMLVIGDKEVEGRSVAVRHREQGDLGAEDINSFLEKLKEEIKFRK